MSQPYYGEIRPFAFNFAPRDWSECNGQTIQVTQNTALYSLIGISFGGDGRVSFKLPDLRGRMPVHVGAVQGTMYSTGNYGGFDYVTLSQSEMPAHTHAFNATTQAATAALITSPNFSGQPGLAAQDFYNSETPDTPLAPSTISHVGGGTSHFNVQPSTALLFAISLSGLYPSRN